MEEIYKLPVGYIPEDVIVSKLNELIDGYNELRQRAIAQDAPPSPYTEVQSEYMGLVANDRMTIEQVAAKWRVAFYDDVSHEFISPVYCVHCQYRSVSLLDRMLLSPTARCAGCIERTKWG